jgi:hypothetical protein
MIPSAAIESGSTIHATDTHVGSSYRLLRQGEVLAAITGFGSNSLSEALIGGHDVSNPRRMQAIAALPGRQFEALWA